MKRIVVRAQCESRAAPSSVYALLHDSSTYPRWANTDEYQMERPGRDAPHSVGEIRVLRRLFVRAREEMIEFIPDRLVAYRLISGLPMDQYRGETRLEPLDNGGTHIIWQSTFFARYPGTGWFWKIFMQSILNDFTSRLAKASENHQIYLS